MGGTFILVGYISWHLIFPGIILIIIVLTYREIYITTGLSLKRLEGISECSFLTKFIINSESLNSLFHYHSHYYFDINMLDIYNDFFSK